MLDREKVIQAMEWCQENACEGCPYDTHNNESCGISDDILTLLKEQEAVVRCKDCKFAFFKTGLVPENHIFCTNLYTERGQAVKQDDWFCGDGKLIES